MWGTKSQDNVHRPQPLKRKESQSRFEPRSLSLPAYRLTARPNRLTLTYCYGVFGWNSCCSKVLVSPLLEGTATVPLFETHLYYCGTGVPVHETQLYYWRTGVSFAWNAVVLLRYCYGPFVWNTVVLLRYWSPLAWNSVVLLQYGMFSLWLKHTCIINALVSPCLKRSCFIKVLVSSC